MGIKTTVPDFDPESEPKRDLDPLPGNFDYPRAMKYTGLGEKALRDAIKNEELICLRIGRLVRFLKSDLDNFLMAKRVITNSSNRHE